MSRLLALLHVLFAFTDQSNSGTKATLMKYINTKAKTFLDAKRDLDACGVVNGGTGRTLVRRRVRLIYGAARARRAETPCWRIPY